MGIYRQVIPFSELYDQLSTKDKSRWGENISYVSTLLDHESEKIQAKALWLLGEMGLEYPDSIQSSVSAVASFCDSENRVVRIHSLGVIKATTSK